MDHSLQSYLERQSTACLRMLLQSYAQQDGEMEQGIYRMIRQELAKREAHTPR